DPPTRRTTAAAHDPPARRTAAAAHDPPARRTAAHHAAAGRASHGTGPAAIDKRNLEPEVRFGLLQVWGSRFLNLLSYFGRGLLHSPLGGHRQTEPLRELAQAKA